MATGRDIYTALTYDCLEDLQLSLGILTDAQFLDMLNLTLVDLVMKTGIVKRVFTQSVFAGQSAYTVPDDIMRVSSVFLAGRYLPFSTTNRLNNSLRNWRRVQDIPKYWYQDSLPIKSIGLAPVPNYNGSYIIGPNEPDPPHAVYDSFSATAVSNSVQSSQGPDAHRGLTVIGPRKPVSLATIDSPIPLLPDDFSLAYVGFGVLERVFSDDSEMQDQQAAHYCGAQFQEGVNLLGQISGEPQETEQ